MWTRGRIPRKRGPSTSFATSPAFFPQNEQPSRVLANMVHLSWSVNAALRPLRFAAASPLRFVVVGALSFRFSKRVILARFEEQMDRRLPVRAWIDGDCIHERMLALLDLYFVFETLRNTNAARISGFGKTCFHDAGLYTRAR